MVAFADGDERLVGQVAKRQVEGARIGLAQNAGGTVNGTDGALSVTILKK